MPSGTISVRAYTSDAQLPVANATVMITQGTGSERRLLSIQFTDSSGKTRPVRIETPPLADSQSPGFPAPYALVDVIIDEPRFRTERLENVGVFPGIETEQAVQLVPLEEFPDRWDLSETQDFPRQNL